MTSAVFDAILRGRMESMGRVLLAKASEYATDADRLHNFKATAAEFGGTPEQACWGFLLKHLTSIRDMVTGEKKPTPGLIEEKIGDAVNYLVLLEAILTEKVRE